MAKKKDKKKQLQTLKKQRLLEQRRNAQSLQSTEQENQTAELERKKILSATRIELEKQKIRKAELSEERRNTEQIALNLNRTLESGNVNNLLSMNFDEDEEPRHKKVARNSPYRITDNSSNMLQIPTAPSMSQQRYAKKKRSLSGNRNDTDFVANMLPVPDYNAPYQLTPEPVMSAITSQERYLRKRGLSGDRSDNIKRHKPYKSKSLTQTQSEPLDNLPQQHFALNVLPSNNNTKKNRKKRVLKRSSLNSNPYSFDPLNFNNTESEPQIDSSSVEVPGLNSIDNLSPQLESDLSSLAVPELSSIDLTSPQLESDLSVPELSSIDLTSPQLESDLSSLAVPELSSTDLPSPQLESELLSMAVPELSSTDTPILEQDTSSLISPDLNLSSSTLQSEQYDEKPSESRTPYDQESFY